MFCVFEYHYRFGVVDKSLLLDTVGEVNACGCIKEPNCWKSICAAHAGLELFNPPFVDRNGDECRLFPFSSRFPFVAVKRFIVDGGRILSLGIGSSSDISE